MAPNAVVSSAFLSATYNIILQILVRVLSSLSNAIIFRIISSDSLGVINVRLLLLYSTCHCLSREAFRRSCLAKFDSKSIEKIFNLLWMVFPVCVLCSCVLRYVWLYLLKVPDPELVLHYSSGVNAVILAVLIECLAEPLFVFSQSSHFVKLKVITEGLMLTVRSVCMVITLNLWPGYAVRCFSISQILGSLVYTSVFYIYFMYYLNSSHQTTAPLLISSMHEVFPKILHYRIDMNDLSLLWSFFKQNLLKQLLTEGERYLMTFFQLLSFSEQGLYDVVNNLGSLAARFIFLPIEDSAYLLFTQLLSREKSLHSQENVSLALNLLQNVVKLMVMLGLTILAFGFSYSQLLLYFYGGAKLSNSLGLTLLRWHCLYVLLISVNGVSEGFKFAVMSRHQIDRYNKILVLLSLGFLLTTYCFVSFFGSAGFILANCLNMTFRIIHSFYFILSQFEVQISWIKNVFPHLFGLCILMVTAVITSISETFLCCQYGWKSWLLHLHIGMICFCVYLLVLWWKENTLVQLIHEQWKKSDSHKLKLKVS